MPASKPPKFLARNSYRRRRMIDAARVLPLVASFLFFIPVLWRPSETPEPDTARGWIYIFAAWVVLIVAALVLSRLLERAGRGADEVADDAEGAP
ncbi:MAG: hypothetical protein KDE00_02125 [Rhodobacteraceae bacterium]|nr:hypothetical protein [Paracoccaceae bacterium]